MVRIISRALYDPEEKVRIPEEVCTVKSGRETVEFSKLSDPLSVQITPEPSVTLQE